MYGKEIASNISGCSNGRVTNAKGLNRYTELFGDFERASSPGLRFEHASCAGRENHDPLATGEFTPQSRSRQSALSRTTAFHEYRIERTRTCADHRPTPDFFFSDEGNVWGGLHEQRNIQVAEMIANQ
jgi:hypothetical protein